MRTARRLIDILMLLQPVVEGVARRRAGPELLRVLVLAFIAALFTAAMVWGGLYALYLAFMASGYMQLHALLMTVASAAVAVMILALLIGWRLRTLRRTAQLPTAKTMATMVDAFMDGLRGRE